MPAAHPDPLVVETTSGAVRGVDRGGLRSWRGIPYAAPPVGPLRFARPQPPEPWADVRDATEYGHAAPQHENKAVTLPEGITLSEDCLTLNVLAPPADDTTQDAASHPRPVLVWVHGGAYVAGTASQPLFDGTHLVQNGDVVYVSLNYRLGALGFLDFSGLAESEGETFDTNLGLRDVLAALTWVQHNIAAFGGDPGNVTLFGESAGGGCVTTLLTSPAASGLFHRAIAESSPATSVYDQQRAKRIAAQFLDLVGVAAPADLRSIDAQHLAQVAFDLVASTSAKEPGTLAIAPVVDGDVVPEHPIDAYLAGRQLAVPLIIGTNRDEASLFRLMKSPLMPITQDSVHAMFAQIVAERPELAEAASEARIEGAYPTFPHHRTPAEVSRDAGFRMPSIWLAAAHSRVAPTRMYRFDHSTPMLRVLGIGATHGAEIAYVFGNLRISKKDFSFDLGGLAEAHRISAVLQQRWLGFARDGRPDAEGAPAWPLYEAATRSTLLIDHGEKIVDDPDAAVREAWGDEPIGFA